MRLALTLCLLTLAATAAVAADYGEKLSEAEVVPIATLLESPDDYLGKTVKIEGRVTGVCAHRGCWIDLAGEEDFQSLRVKVEDGVIVFPAEAVGKVATAEGVFTRIELTPEQAKAMHEATCQEGGEKKEGASCAHEVPEEGGVVYRVDGVGAVIQ